jgi:hypothetical protein
LDYNTVYEKDLGPVGFFAQTLRDSAKKMFFVFVPPCSLYWGLADPIKSAKYKGVYLVHIGGPAMGIMNLLKANWTGKVGQTVGAKWKNKSTIRTFTKPAYSDTPAQQEIRAGFGEQSAFVALFADQIKSLSALDTKGMSVRNAILKLNKAQIPTGDFDPTTLQISRGGLPQPTGITVTAPAGLASLHAVWTPAVGATISAKAKVVIVAVNKDTNFAAVGTAANTAGQLDITVAVPPSVTLAVYAYLVDYRGSSRVGSVSSYRAVTTPAS